MDQDNKAQKIPKIQESNMLDESQKGSRGITYKTVGTTLQALSVQLDQGEQIYSEVGKMSWMTSNIKLETKGRGFGKMISRLFTGESFFLNEFTSEDGTGIVTFSTDQAGKIVPIDLGEGRPDVIFQKGGFLCAENNVELTVAFTRRLSAGIFGGKGWILQKVTGEGMAHLIADGEVVMYELEEGEEILVDQGNLLAYESTVDFDIQTVKGGAKNWFFGGEGIFHGVMRGPGKVWLQTRKLSISSYAAGSAAQYQGNSGGFAQNPLGCIIGILLSLGSFIFFIIVIILSSL